MKLSFTTLGCPDWDLPTILTRAVEYGYDGIDFRGLHHEMNIYQLPEFSTNLEETKDRIAQSGLAISCLSSSVSIAKKERFDQNIAEVEQFASLCNHLGTKYIRVFGGAFEGDRSEAINVALEVLERVKSTLRTTGAKLLLETHDSWIASEHVAALVKDTDPELFGVLWDVHHPYRMLGEKPSTTWELLGSRIEYTHWKDSFLDASYKNGFRYGLMGEGDIPFKDIASVLKQNGYDNWYTFEWEKKWHPDIAEPEVALPQYVRYMRELA